RKSPTFIGIPIFCCRADRKRRHLVQEEIQSMIVVNDDGDVGLHSSEPVVGRLVSRKKVFPIRIVVKPASDCLADRWDMGCCDSANNLGHVYSTPALTSISLNCSSVMPRCCAPIC